MAHDAPLEMIASLIFCGQLTLSTIAIPVACSAVALLFHRTAITVIGNVTRLQYRFATSSVPVAVDARDRGSLARVPLLREVR
jgi:hypothetical protein